MGTGKKLVGNFYLVTHGGLPRLLSPLRRHPLGHANGGDAPEVEKKAKMLDVNGQSDNL